MANIEITTKFISRSTVWIQAKVYDPETDELTDPTNTDHPIEVNITDPNKLKKAGYIGVSSSASFTAGLVVTGATSGATGYVKSTPDGGVTLELQRVTGVWQSGETIEDTGTGTSTTTSVLEDAAMSKHESETGIYDYFYDTDAVPVEGWYPCEVTVLDGVEVGIKTSIASFGFEVEKGL